MKNIHILPTDKPSRLLQSLKVVELLDKEWLAPIGNVNRNIYITSDEEIKDVRPHNGKWQLEKGQILNKFPDYLTDLSECKLVIMTTDPDLIKDGVQSIDDEFLEWFVKNPSCEWVEVVKEEFYSKNDFINGRDAITYNYKIIIPSKEPKYPIGGYAPGYYSCTCVTCKSTFQGDKRAVQCEPCAIKITKEEPKQETLEEVELAILFHNTYEKLAPSFGYETREDTKSFDITTPNGKLMIAVCKEIIKWQQERMYSEAIEFGEWIRVKDFQTASKDNWIGLDMKYYTTEELFEQFKKK